MNALAFSLLCKVVLKRCDLGYDCGLSSFEILPKDCVCFISICTFTSCSSDTTETGYALGDPAQRRPIPSPERSLPPAACAILRAFVHCSLLWASCNNEVKLYNRALQYTSCVVLNAECYCGTS